MNHMTAIQTEVDASYLYQVLSDHEQDPELAKIFREMSEIEKKHALSFLIKNSKKESDYPAPSLRAKLLHKLGSWVGYDLVLGVLLDTEKNLSRSILAHRRTLGIERSLSDTAHVLILQNILNKPSSQTTQWIKFENRHRTIGGNALRAAVLGGNDGLVSNFSLIMGVAGAAADQHVILLAGLAGLLAGALSMALGEWISVRSSQELYENQAAIEEEELSINPEGELKELALIYRTKGMTETQALEMARSVMSDPENAKRVLIQEELGIHPEELQSSPMEAALASFVLFAIGAILPLLPFFFISGTLAIGISVALSAVGLFGIGAGITLFTGKSMWYSGLRQVVFGIAAAALTYGIGKWSTFST